MFFGRNNNIDDDFEENNESKEKIDLSTFKLPLIILGSIIFVIIVILIIAKLISKDRVVYEEKLYYINLLGDSNITLYLDEDYVEPGYTGTDDEGNDLTKEVVISNDIDNSNVGNYKVSYTLGNITKERNIKVIEKPTGATYIYLYGDVNTFLYIGETYQEKGYEVIDTIDGGNLKDKVKIDSNVDTSKEGIYRVIYSVTNTSGVTTSQKRTVIVIDKNLSLIPNITDSTNKNVAINIYVKDELFSYLILPNNNKTTERISTYEVNSNGTYKFIIYNDRGESTEKSITINNIDRESPSGSCSGSYGNGISTISIKASDNVGISKYILNKVSYTTNNIRLNEELSSVNITIYDTAGNSKNISCKLTNNNLSLSSASPTYYKSEFVLKHYDKTDGFSFDYWLNVPKNATSGLPLIMFLHGGCYVKDPKAVLSLKQVDYAVNKYNGTPFIFIVPVNETRDWHSIISIPTSLKALLDETIKTYKINTNKIYIMGFSMGAIGTWNMVDLYPNYFAAAIPISCCQAPQNSANNFLHTKIRAISGTYDPNNEGYYNRCMNNFVSAINDAGGSAIKDTYPGYSHSTISSVIKYDELFDWLLKQ